MISFVHQSFHLNGWYLLSLEAIYLLQTIVLISIMQPDYFWMTSLRVTWIICSLALTTQTYAFPDEPLTLVTTGISTTVTATSSSIDPDQVSSSVSLATGSASATAVPHTSVPDCVPEAVGDYSPFCLPLNGSDKYPNEQYYGMLNTLKYQGCILTVCSNMEYCMPLK